MLLPLPLAMGLGREAAADAIVPLDDESAAGAEDAWSTAAGAEAAESARAEGAAANDDDDDGSLADAAAAAACSAHVVEDE